MRTTELDLTVDMAEPNIIDADLAAFEAGVGSLLAAPLSPTARPGQFPC